MRIDEFVKKYDSATRPIERVVQRWVAEKQIRDFLGTTIMAGATVADLMVGDKLVDTIPPDVKEAFATLTGPVADSREEIERIILEKIELGDQSVFGLINKIQGPLGENIFTHAIGSSAQLAESGSQPDWDVRVSHEDGFQYVQVKVYETAHYVPLETLKAKLEAGAVLDHGNIINHLDIAVPSDIYDDVRERASEIGYPGEILNLHVMHDDIRDHLVDSFGNVQHGFAHFFTELAGDVAVPAMMHAAVNGFLLYKGAKDRRRAVEDTGYSTSISAGGMAAAHAVDQALGHALLALDLQDAAAVIASPAGGILLLAVGMTVRAFLRRIANRRFVVERLEVNNKELTSLIVRIEAIGTKLSDHVTTAELQKRQPSFPSKAQLARCSKRTC